MPHMPKYFTRLCTPAKIYAVLALLSVILYVSMMNDADKKNESDIDVHRYTVIGVTCKVVFSIVWVLVLNYLCKKGHGNWAWFLLLMPIFLMVMGTMFMVSYTMGATQAQVAGQKKPDNLQDSTQGQGWDRGQGLDGLMNQMTQMTQMTLMDTVDQEQDNLSL